MANQFTQFWQLDQQVIFLNHGSFGACPIPVLQVQQQLRNQLEQEPVRFFGREFEPLLDQARTQLAQFVGAKTSEIAFIPNATTGVNSILRSLFLSPQDQLLVTDQEYNACRNALNYVAEHSGAEIVVASIPFPIDSPQQVIEAILQGVTERTKLLLIDHITSQTALIFPIQHLAQELTARGIDILVDGAHAPGQIELNLQQLGVTYYTGNCHKWLCAPKGAAFLYVREDKQQQIRPLTISHGANATRCDRTRYHLEFDWMGTDDPSAILSIPSTIEFMGSLFPGGWPELMQRNHQKVLAARNLLCEALNIPLPCPDAMIGSMASIPLPQGSHDQLHDILFDQYHIEAQIVPFPASPDWLIRLSAQVYNTVAEYEKLVDALLQILG